jgi:hypothetical protein
MKLQMRSQAAASCFRFLWMCVLMHKFSNSESKTKHSRIAVRTGSSSYSLFRTYSCIIILWFNPLLHPQVLCLLLLFVLSHVYTTHSKSQSRVHKMGQIQPILLVTRYAVAFFLQILHLTSG